MKERKDIFISYRRFGGEWFAYCIYLKLRAAGYSVFFDVASLKNGSFEKDIVEHIKVCKDFILVLPPHALERCVEIDDLVYKEIKTAKDYGKNIIPLMMDGFSLPSRNLFEENHVLDRYEYLEYAQAMNGCNTNGIMNLEGTLLHLTRDLLMSVPNMTRNQEKAITLETLFSGYETDKMKTRPEYELLPNLSTSEFFVEGSRDKEIAWLSDAIERMQPAFVWGFGGVGKTELAMEFARYHSHYRNVSFVTFSNSMRETVIQMKFAGYEMPDLNRLSKEDREVAEEKIYQEKLKLLNAYSADDILIIDNFEKSGKTLAELKRESAYKDVVGSKMHVVFTTRNRPDKYTPELQPLTKDELLDMMRHYLGETMVSEELLIQLINAVDSHTMAVELIAKLIADEFSCITPEEILAAFTSGKVKNLSDAEVDSYKDREYKETTIFEHIKLLFDLSALSDSEMAVLRHAFFISTIGMKTDVFIRIGKEHWGFHPIPQDKSAFVPYEKLVKGLVNKGWLRIKNGSIFIHPLVKEVMWEENKMNLDPELSYYLEHFNAPQHNPICIHAENKLTEEEWHNIERMRAEYMANVFCHFNNSQPMYAAETAVAFWNCWDIEQVIIYSHYALDLMLINKKKDEKYMHHDFWALHKLEEIWCPKMIESSWDPDIYYGSELYEEHDEKPDNVQSIYYKIQLWHDIRPVNRKDRYVEISEDGTVLQKFNYFEDTEYIIPDGIIKIAHEAFRKCINLESLVMPDSVEELGKDAFLDCEKLKSIRLSEKIKKLPYGTFCGCKNLKEISIPDNVEIIGQEAFLACNSLEYIKMPKKLHTIENGAFQNCFSIRYIELPDGLRNLNGKIFQGCRKLKEIFIPRSVEKISPALFQDSHVCSIVVDEENKWYCSGWGSLFTKDRKKLVCCPPANPVFQIFEETEEIGEFACQGNFEITEVELSKNIRKLCNNAFGNCINLNSITCSEGVEIMEDYCFHSCSRLKRVVLPKSLKQIGEGVFYNCNRLKMLELPVELEGLGRAVFEKCYMLEKLTIPRKIKKIPSELCKECYELKEVILAEGTSEIRYSAFADCINLKKIKNTNAVNLVEGVIFQNCIHLEIPQLDSQCMNGRNLDFPAGASVRENSVKLMVGYDEYNMSEEKKEYIEWLKQFAQEIGERLRKR